MSFSISFFARDVHSARSKLREAYAPEAVKALIELALAAVPPQNHISLGAGASANGRTSDAAKEASNQATPRSPRLCGILVETHGHIDESGGRSNIGLLRVEPYYD